MASLLAGKAAAAGQPVVAETKGSVKGKLSRLWQLTKLLYGNEVTR